MRPIPTLLAALCLACGGNGPTASSQPEYPRVVAEGTYVSVVPYGDRGAYLALAYTDTSDHLTEWVFDTSVHGYATFKGRDVVTIPEPLYPGNHFVLTQTDSHAFTLAKPAE